MRPTFAPWLLRLLIAATCWAAATDVLAWGDEGHEIIAAIAYARLTPATRKAVDSLLASDQDTLTSPDFVTRATWADRYRDADRNTSKKQYNATRQWHYVDIEIDGGTLDEACFHHPSRLFETGLSPFEVVEMSGHKTLQRLKRYTHFGARKLAKKLG